MNRRRFISALSGIVAWAKIGFSLSPAASAIQSTCEECGLAVGGDQQCVLADAYGAARWFHADCYSRHIDETDPLPSDGLLLRHRGAWQFLGTTPRGSQVFGDPQNRVAIQAMMARGFRPSTRILQGANKARTA